MKLVHIVGARPNFIKVAPVYAACTARGATQVLVHTGQHYDEQMSSIFFRELELVSPDYNLEIGSGSHAEQVAHVMLRFEKLVQELAPDAVLVYGDVNSTLAAALVCAKLGIRVAHVEAGLRSFDRRMPEEINRLLTDQIADLLFTPSEDANANLLQEGIAEDRIRLVGNVMIDTLVKYLPAAGRLDRTGYPDRYALVTLHRPSNVDDLESLSRIIECLGRISHKLPVVFPVHPRTARQITSGGLNVGAPGVHLYDPLGYLEFLNVEQHAVVVITDSGGIQEETTFLSVPCLTLRENTERPITVTMGTNRLIGTDYALLEREVDAVLEGKVRRGQVPPLWDGHTAERIAAILVSR